MSSVHPSVFSAWLCTLAVLSASALYVAESKEVATRYRDREQQSIVRSPRGPRPRRKTASVHQVAVEPGGVNVRRYETFPQEEETEADEEAMDTSASDAAVLDTEVQREDIAEDVRAELEALESEDATLRAENVRLRHELASARTPAHDQTRRSVAIEEDEERVVAPVGFAAKHHSQSNDALQEEDLALKSMQSTVTKPPVPTSHGTRAHHAAASGLKNKVDASWTFDPSKCDADSNTHCTSWLRFCTCKNPEQGEEQSCHLYMPYVHKHCQTTCGKEGIRCPRAAAGCSDSQHMLPANLSSNPPRLHSECHDWKHKKCPTAKDPDNSCDYCSPCTGNGWVKTVCKATCGLCNVAAGGNLLEGEHLAPSCTEETGASAQPALAS
mmetsp:Transcript_6231/g.14904  ORF Transcript_6231/g.14904 Transcript_6231/m.14904 type:complete len:384 (+) Transcript_6231:54-1205(+)